jgi:hypothetical protein
MELRKQLITACMAFALICFALQLDVSFADVNSPSPIDDVDTRFSNGVQSSVFFKPGESTPAYSFSYNNEESRLATIESVKTSPLYTDSEKTTILDELNRYPYSEAPAPALISNGAPAPVAASPTPSPTSSSGTTPSTPSNQVPQAIPLTPVGPDAFRTADGRTVNANGEELTQYADFTGRTIPIPPYSPQGQSLATISTQNYFSNERFGGENPLTTRAGDGFKVKVPNDAGGFTEYYVQDKPGLFGSSQVVGIMRPDGKYDPLDINDPQAKQLLESLLNEKVEKSRQNYEAARACGQGRACGAIYDINQFTAGVQNWGGLSYLFMSQEERAQKMAEASQIFDRYTSTGWAQSICLTKIDNPPQGTGYVQLPQGQGLGVAATIYGECLRQPGINGQEQILYKIGGFAKNPGGTFAGSTIKFNIYVNGPSGKVYLYEQTQELKNGETRSLQGRNAFVQQTTNRYDQVCVEFQNPPEFWQSNLICNNIVCSNAESSSYSSPPANIVIQAQNNQQSQTQTGPRTGWSRI